MPLALNYDILNDAPATATPVEANFNRVEQYTNQELISRDGSVEMIAQLKLVGDPVSPRDAATKQYVDQFLPIGIIMMFGGVAAPPGGRWAVCNGAELEVALWQDLFDVIGRNWTAAAVPAGRFNLPNFGDRVAVGVGAVTAIGATGGRRDGTTIPHTHPIDHNHASFNTGNNSVGHVHSIAHNHPVATSSTIAAHTHPTPSNMDQYLGWNPGAGIGSTAAGNNTVLGTTTGSSGSHNHTVDVPSFSGNSGSQNVNHVHAADVPAYTGASGAASGAIAAADVANANMQPYLGVPHIMRVA